VPQRIRAEASRLFSEQGYTATSVRQIAAAADADAATVLRHFESKEKLFLETMSVDRGFRGLVEGPLDELARMMLERLVANIDPDTRHMYRALVQQSDRPDVHAYLEATLDRHITAPLAERLRGDDAQLRARLVAAQLVGLMQSLWVNRDSYLNEMPLARVLDAYAAPIQLLIDGE
jgi:AcrR family transcriptional regulator